MRNSIFKKTKVLIKRMGFITLLNHLKLTINNTVYQNFLICGKVNFPMIIYRKNCCLNFIKILNCQQKKIGKTFWVSKINIYLCFQTLDLIKEMLRSNK
jgi:hypothetical protein